MTNSQRVSGERQRPAPAQEDIFTSGVIPGNWMSMIFGANLIACSGNCANLTHASSQTRAGATKCRAAATTRERIVLLLDRGLRNPTDEYSVCSIQIAHELAQASDQFGGSTCGRRSAAIAHSAVRRQSSGAR